MDTYYYGTDSFDDSRDVMPKVKAIWGCYPSHQTRYVGTPEASRNDEVAYNYGLGIRQAFVYNRYAGEEFPLLTAAEGEAHALEAIAAVSRLTSGIKTLTWRDIESGQPVTIDYLTGWSKALDRLGWPGGFYGPWSQASYAALYDQIIGAVPRRSRLLWTAEWTGYVPPPGPTWQPTILVQDPSAVVCWQFAGNALGKLVDCNLATAEAYGLMFGVPAAATAADALVWRTTARVGLKQQPNTSSDLAFDEHRKDVVIELGAVVEPGPDIQGREKVGGYTHVRIPQTRAHGWLLSLDIKQDST